MLFAFKPEQTYGQSKEQRIKDFCQTWQEILKSRNESPKKKIRKVWPLGARTSKFPISTKLGDPRKRLSPGSSLKSPVATHPRAFGKGKRSFGEWTHNPLLITFRGLKSSILQGIFARLMILTHPHLSQIRQQMPRGLGSCVFLCTHSSRLDAEVPETWNPHQSPMRISSRQRPSLLMFNPGTSIHVFSCLPSYSIQENRSSCPFCLCSFSSSFVNLSVVACFLDVSLSAFRKEKKQQKN